MTPVQSSVSLIPMLQKELEMEALTTRKMLERVPEDKFGWQPHRKSMTLLALATHIAELPTWIPLTINTEELDFATSPYKPTPIANKAELLAFFERSLDEGRAALSTVTEEQLEQFWILRDGEQIYSNSTKAETVRHAISQVIHHRAQLGVYLRLLDIPIPGSYGPSADEQF